MTPGHCDGHTLSGFAVLVNVWFLLWVQDSVDPEYMAGPT